jgi:glycosyltransferase involved in cell wall biosynthesis
LKLLLISNFYPPIRAWGYTLWCSEVSSLLKASRHEVFILTSNYQAGDAPTQEGVFRLLHLENDLNYYSIEHFFRRWKKDEQENRRNIHETIAKVAPDLIFVWGMYGLSRSIPAACEAAYPDRTVYYISDHWPADRSFNQVYWDKPATSALGRLAKHPLAHLARKILSAENYPPRLEFKHAITVSEAVRQNLINAGLPFEHNVTIHGGSDAQRFLYRRSVDKIGAVGGKIRVLYAGALAEHKGVHTILDGIVKIKELLLQDKIELSLVGSGHPDYERRLKSQIAHNDLERWVQLPGRIDPENMPALLRSYDILLFPSIYDEPLPRMVQEAMLAGMLVIGTTTGGTKDLLIEGQTGLTFPAGDPDRLAQQLRWSIDHPAKAAGLAQQGQEYILEHFTLEKMVGQIERYLINLAL